MGEMGVLLSMDMVDNLSLFVNVIWSNTRTSLEHDITSK